MSGAEIVTFGCRLNAYESEVMRTLARTAGLDNAIIVNTCTVTGEAERQARQAIRRLRRQHPSAKIIVTGCAAQVNPQGFAAMPEVDRVVGNGEKLRLSTWRAATGALAGEGPRVAVADIMTVRATAGHLIEGFDGRARAFLEVQQGCDHRCTFCIIPYARGNSRSVPLAAIVDQARRLVAAGYREIVLTGVDLTAYGADLAERPTLGRAVRHLLAAVPALPRLRLSSLDVAEVDDDLLALLADEPRLAPHLHLSLQAGNDMILKRMRRRHSRRQAVALCAEARRRRADVVVGADLIAGFPTETEAMFADSMSLIDDCGLTWLHVFPFSPRRGTPAARLPQWPGGVRKERAQRLRAAGNAAAARWLGGRVGSRAQVLVERDRSGRDEYYAAVELDRDHPAGSLVGARITGVNGSRLAAQAGA